MNLVESVDKSVDVKGCLLTGQLARGGKSQQFGVGIFKRTDRESGQADTGRVATGGEHVDMKIFPFVKSDGEGIGI